MRLRIGAYIILRLTQIKSAPHASPNINDNFTVASILSLTSAQVLYAMTAAKAFQFCLTYKRATEFHRLCDILRNHLANLNKYVLLLQLACCINRLLYTFIVGSQAQ